MLDKSYNPQKYEDKIYKLWEESGFFAPEAHQPWVDNPETREKFSITLPPPNVTGTLHIGHAYEDSLQDVFTRFWRMRGKKTLWLPGTDHAAIATQSKVEKKIYEEENKSRYDLGREEFLRRVNKFALESQNVILNQLKKLGLSLDWSRLAYTLDETRASAVFESFKRMYEAGLIYRGYRVINWDPRGQTTVSDDEVVYKESKGTLYTFRYSKDFPISIASTRPETKLGDVAVAVHPDDARYKEFVGKTYKVNFAGAELEIKIIADKEADVEFGTGAIGVTPAHSMIDWELAQRHSLPLKQVIDENARIIETGTNLDGKKTDEARKEIVEWLKKEGLLEKEEEASQNISTAERTGATIEPLPKLQWFVSVDSKFEIQNSNLNGIPSGSKTSLKEILRKTVESGQIQIIPEQFEKRYFHWVDNLRDWCISRQIWFGHQIPVYYCANQESGIRSQEFIVSNIKPENCPICGKCEMEQDPDTLDTWFSSGLWTFSTLGWPQKTKDLSAYHPTDLMSPGYEILNLWVSRMIFLSGFLLGDIPFKIALIHGIVRDKQGRKFSKSSGIGGDPLEVIGQYGADALRMALSSGVAIGNDPTFDIEKVKAYKHFTNKIWNATRFVLMKLEDFEPSQSIEPVSSDQKTLDEFKKVAKDITGDIEEYRLHLAAEKLYHYFWHTFADKIIEDSKERLESKDEKERQSVKILLYTLLTEQLKLIHPFMPFVTEAIWQELPHKETDLIMVAKWPI